MHVAGAPHREKRWGAGFKKNADTYCLIIFPVEIGKSFCVTLYK